jgi:signal peptidase II
LRRYFRDYLFLGLVGGFVIALDQITKSIVRTQLAFEQVWSPWDWLTPFARIVHWKNTGAAFGILRGYNLIFSILAIIVAIGIIYIFPRIPRQDWIIRLAVAMQFGGAIGNLVDRLTRGEVTDFISLGSFAVFNVADSSITVGVAVLLLGVWLKERQEKANSARIAKATVTTTGESGINE